MKQVLSYVALFALTLTLSVATAQEKPKAASGDKAKSGCVTSSKSAAMCGTKASSCGDKVQVKHASKKADGCCAGDAKQASKKADGCCTDGAKHASKQDCGKECGPDCKMAHNMKSGGK